MSTNLIWLAEKLSTRHRTITLAATLAQDTGVVVPLELLA